MHPFTIQRILAPFDLSDSGLPALRMAEFFAGRFGASLTVLYADPIVYPIDIAGDTAAFLAPRPEQEALLKIETEQRASAVLTRPFETAVAVGQPVPMIIRTADERRSDLIVVGTHAHSGWRRALLGSVSEAVLHNAKCPVLTVSAHDPLPARTPAVTKILCPINFTEVARESVAYASSVAAAFEAELIVVHVIEPDEVKDAGADELLVREWVTPALTRQCTFRQLVLRGGASERVLDCADDLGADLLVIGAQHRRFRDATVIGTTTERLVRFANSPVLVVTRQVEARRQEELLSRSAGEDRPAMRAR